MISIQDRRRALLSFANAASRDTVPSSPHPIAEVRAFQMPAVPPGHPYIVLQVRTESGLIGYGECRSLSAADLKATNAAIAGRAASAYEVLGSRVPKNVQGGLNIALLDILGKATQAPVYRVLGGPTRNKVRAITRLMGTSDEELERDLQKQLASGFRAFLIPIPSPSALNQGSPFIHAATVRLKMLRSSVPDADFAFEAAGQLTPGDAATLATAVESMHPLWFDEPCEVSNLLAIHKIADETVVPLGFGRTVPDAGTFQAMLREGLIDLLLLDPRVHGITGIRRLAAMAETYYVDIAPWNDGGPIASAAAIHAAASIPNFFIAQLPNSGTGPVPKNGFFELSKAPGLGITIDEKELERNRIA
jgi:galactonate dehydratase